MIQPDDSIRVKIAGLQVDAKEFVRIFFLLDRNISN